MISVKQLLDTKGYRHVCTLTSEHMVIDALGLMLAENIGSVVIVDGHDLVGLFFRTRLRAAGHHPGP
jgi:CBS domain-containing protein